MNNTQENVAFAVIVLAPLVLVAAIILSIVTAERNHLQQRRADLLERIEKAQVESDRLWERIAEVQEESDALREQADAIWRGYTAATSNRIEHLDTTTHTEITQ